MSSIKSYRNDYKTKIIELFKNNMNYCFWKNSITSMVKSKNSVLKYEKCFLNFILNFRGTDQTRK